ncbi:MAG: glycosyltransferase family 39 protein [Candidatus Altiarchaeota archaeon]
MSSEMDDRALNYVIAATILLLSVFIVVSPNPDYFSWEYIYQFFTLVLTVTLLTGVFLAWLERRSLAALFRLDHNAIRLLVLIVFMASVLRVLVVPHVHRVLFDESIYMQISALIATSGKAMFCDKWIDGECLSGFLNKQPNAFPHALSLFFLVFGVSESVGFGFTTLLGILSIPLIFLSAYLLFGDMNTALFSALFLSLTPAHIIWSGSVSTEIFHVFMSLTVLTLAVSFIKTRSWRLLVSCACFLAYTIQARPESILLVPVVYILFASYDFKDMVRRDSRFIDYVVLFSTVLVVLSLLHLAHLSYASRTQDWGSSEGKFDLKYLNRNWDANTGYWLDGRKHIIVLTPLVLVGFLAGLKSKHPSVPAVSFWLVSFYLSYLFFYGGSFAGGGVGFRYALLCYPPMLILSAYGASFIVESLSKHVLRRDAVLFMTVLVLVTSLPAYGFISQPDPLADTPRMLHEFAVEMADNVEDDCVVLTDNPNIFIIHGQNTMQTGMGVSRDSLKNLMRTHPCVYFLEGYWCNTQPKKQVCDQMHDYYDLERVASAHAPDTGWSFNFYKIKLIY